MSPEFWLWWQGLPSRMEPYLFEAGGFRVGYYGLMYLAAFGTVYFLSVYRDRRDGFGYGMELIQDFMFWGIVGVVLGGRLGYVLFYNLEYYSSRPLEILLPFKMVSGGWRYTGIAGMSYHGGVLGLAMASAVFLRRRGVDFWRFSDLMVPAFPLGYTFGRIGNFINGELYGRPTEAPWGMYFPMDQEGLLRHPSQLYEGAFEGLVLFAVLWWLRGRISRVGMMLPMYLMGYGVFRFFLEYYREPDAHLGFVLLGFSMGQVLCLGMIGAGLAIIAYRMRR